jgi:hypothetical protein
MPDFFSVHCPHCRSVDFRTVGVLNFIERALFRLLQPCRCELCGHHFFVFRWQTPIAEAT